METVPRPATNPAPTEHAAEMRLKDAMGRFLALIEPLRVELWNERGLTVGQLRLIFAVRDQSGASMGEAGATIGLGGSSLTGLVDRVAALGLLERRQDPLDRRITRLSLTEEGHQLAQELEARRQDVFAYAFGRLTTERQALLAELFDEFVTGAEAASTALTGKLDEAIDEGEAAPSAHR